jgi:hypothetical protein
MFHYTVVVGGCQYKITAMFYTNSAYFKTAGIFHSMNLASPEDVFLYSAGVVTVPFESVHVPIDEFL